LLEKIADDAEHRLVIIHNQNVHVLVDRHGLLPLRTADRPMPRLEPL
jgi:hypothetical protein